MANDVYKTVTCTDNSDHKINLNEDEVCIIRIPTLFPPRPIKHVLCKECTLIRKEKEPNNDNWVSRRFMSPDETASYLKKAIK